MKIIGAIARTNIELKYIKQNENTREEHTFEFPVEDKLTLTRLVVRTGDRVIQSKVQRKE